MIKFRNDLKVNNTGIAYASMLDSIKDLYSNDPILAGEYAISAFELILSGDCSTDNYVIRAMLNPIKAMTDRNMVKLEARKEKQDNNRIEKMQLREVADLYIAGYKQQEIAKMMNTSRQTISNRIKIIQTEFPELLVTENDAEMDTSEELQGEYLGGTIKVSDLNASNLEYDIIDNFAYFPSTGVRLRIVPDA